MRKLAASCFAVGVAISACTTAPEGVPAPRVAVGGDSPIVGATERVASTTGVPAELLSTIAYIETRFRIAHARDHHGRDAVGIFGLAPDTLAHGAELAGVSPDAASTEIEAGLRAGAALLREAAPAAVTLDDFIATLEPDLQRSVLRSFARGIDARDVDGKTIVIAARRLGDDGYGTISQAVDAPTEGYDGADWNPALSSNYDVANRSKDDITNVVIHTTQGGFAGTISWFQNPSAKVSAHYVVRSEDGYIVQMVDEKDIAWHDKCFNDHTVGIEHEGFVEDPTVWYTEPMYVASARLTSYLCDKYGIEKAYGPIIGHDSAPDCSTHTDPGEGWDWAHYIELVKFDGATFEASDVVIDAPAKMVSGEHATVIVHLTNRGNAAWEPDVTRIGTALPQDRDSELYVDGDWIAPNRATSIDRRVEPGEAGTFTFDIVAPDVDQVTSFDEGFQLVEEDMGWFGPDLHLVVEVSPDGGGCSAGGGRGGGLLVLLVGLATSANLRRRRRPRRRR